MLLLSTPFTLVYPGAVPAYLVLLQELTILHFCYNHTAVAGLCEQMVCAV